MQQESRREVLTSSLAASVVAAGVTQARDAQAQDSSGTPQPAKKRDWWDKPFRMLVTLGESTTAGGWASYRERAWAHQLARLINEFQRIPVQLVNVGIGGNVISKRST